MMGLLQEGNKVWITESLNPSRKLKYTLQIMEINNSKVGVNTHFTNKIVNHGLENNLIKYFSNKVKISKEKVFNKRQDLIFTLKIKAIKYF